MNDPHIAEPQPSPVEKPQTAEESDPPWTWFFAAAVAAIVAILCFTPVWGMVAPTEYRDHGRRAGFSNLILTLGPVGVAGIAAGVAVITVLIGVFEMRKQRSVAASEAN